MINLMIIYDVVNIFSMKTYTSSRKLRVGLNWYQGVNWSTTTSFCNGEVMSRDVPICNITNILAICREVLNRENREVLHLGKSFISNILNSKNSQAKH